MHEVLVNRLGGLSLPRKSVVRLTDRPDMTLDVYRGRKTAMQQQQSNVKKLKILLTQLTMETSTLLLRVVLLYRKLWLNLRNLNFEVCAL